MNLVPTSTATRMVPLGRRILAIVLAVVLVIGLMPAMPQHAWAASKGADGYYTITIAHVLENGTPIKTSSDADYANYLKSTSADSTVGTDGLEYVSKSVALLESAGYVKRSQDLPTASTTYGAAKNRYTVTYQDQQRRQVILHVLKNNSEIYTFSGMAVVGIHTIGETVDDRFQAFLSNNGYTVENDGGYNAAKGRLVSDKHEFTVVVAGGNASSATADSYWTTVRLADNNGNAMELYSGNSAVAVKAPTGTSYAELKYNNKKLSEIVDEAAAANSADYTVNYGTWPGDGGKVGSKDADYTIVLTPKQVVSSTAVTVNFVDQYGQAIVVPGTSNLASLSLTGPNKASFSTQNDWGGSWGKASLNDMVNTRKQQIEQGYSNYVLDTAKSNYNTNGVFGPNEQIFTIVYNKTTTLESATIAAPANVVYDGSEHWQEPTITQGGKTLVKGTDYYLYYPGVPYDYYDAAGNKTATITEPGQRPINVGTYTVRIQGLGDYAGSEAAARYQIVPTDISATLSQTAFKYNGKAQKPSVNVRWGKNYAGLKENQDYTIAWPSDTTNPGVKDVVVAGKGNFSGSVALAYTIAEADPTPVTPSTNVASKTKVAIPTAKTGLVYNGSSQEGINKGTGAAQISFTGTVSATNAGSYTATASLKDTSKYEWEDGTTASKTIRWSIAKKGIGTDSKTITALNPGSTTYSGKEQAPKVTVKDGNTVLKEGTDYTISWQPNAKFVEAGTYTGTITGKGAYTGSRTVSYTIKEPPVRHAVTIEFVDEKGSPIADGGSNSFIFRGVEGTALTTEIVNKVNDRLKELQNRGWQVLSNPFKGTGEKVGSADRTITIKLKASTTIVTRATYGSIYKPGTALNKDGSAKVPANLELAREITRTIIYKMPDSTKPPANTVQKVKFERTATVDNTNGQVVSYSDWKLQSNSPKNWPEVVPPAVKGYTADKVAADNAITATRNDKTVTVNYKAQESERTITIKIVCFNSQGKETSSTTLTSSATPSTKLSAKSSDGKTLTAIVDEQVNANKRLGLTGIDWGGWDKDKSGTYGSAKSSYTIKMSEKIWHRLRGSGQYDTMAAIVSDTYGWDKGSGGTVIVATGEGYQDALSAAGAAGLTGAPVLITASKTLSPQTRSELVRIKPNRVIIVGGRVAVTTAVESAIKSACGVTPERVRGASPSDTAAEIAKKFFPKGTASTAILATSLGYQDALSAAPVSYSKHLPIFLADGQNSISSTTISAMKACGIQRVIVVGGSKAISEAIVGKLAANGIQLQTRLSGRSAYDTSRDIANWGIRNGMSANLMGVATGLGFTDALCGAALCGKNNAVLVLADASNSSNTSVSKANKASISRAYVFGGKFAVSEPVFSKFEASTK